MESSPLDFFNKEYQWSSRNRDDCSYSYLTFQEIIDNNEYVRKLNGDDRYFKFYIKMQTATDFYPRKIFRCPCL